MACGSIILNQLWRRNASWCIFNMQRVSQLHLSAKGFQYKEQQKKFDSNEQDILNKSKTPSVTNKVIVSEPADVVKPKAASSYTNFSMFYDDDVNKFVNIMMHGGKKSVSQAVMRETFTKVKKIQLERYHKASDKSNVELDPLKIFHQALENAMPVLGTQTMKKKGKNFHVPYPLPVNRRRFLAIKWFLTTARGRPGNSTPMSTKLSKEILDAYKNEGAVIQKKIDHHKKAELHRAFAHYRWW